ncbi:MAG: hypothetical protein ABSA83_15055 [Verrucomicrobiota bacterium]
MKKCVLLLVMLILLALADCLPAQGTAFTYQGQLMTAGAPANGVYDLQFILYTASVGGDQTGPILTNSIAVSNGLFIVELNFGSNVFAGANYWLDIAVRTNGPGTYAELSPRQELTPAPYAVFANTASNLLGWLPADQLSGTILLARLPGAVVTNDEVGVTTLSNVTVGGNLNLPALTDATGIIYAGGTTLVHGDANNNFYAGPGAGNLDNTGTGNTGTGYEALQNSTNGVNNTAIGYEALQNNTSGSQNTALGERALSDNTTGTNNTAVGRHALSLNTNGADNTANGYEALANNTGGAGNVAMGSQALQNTTNDFGDVAIGYQALQNENAPEGFGANTAVGCQALQSDTSGQFNTAIGFSALSVNTGGGDNTAIGGGAMYGTTIGGENTAIGEGTIYYNTIGSDNTAIGSGALLGFNGAGNLSTNANDNTAVG